MAKKTIANSIRLSEEVYDYIQNYSGNGFNEKFENIILYACRSEKVREERIELLDAQIKIKEKEYHELYESVDSLRVRIHSFVRNFYTLENELGAILGIVKKK